MESKGDDEDLDCVTGSSKLTVRPEERRGRPRNSPFRCGPSLTDVVEMLPLYEDPCFTFHFADDRLIPRFHLEGVEAGRRVEVYKIDPGTGERLGLLATATAGEVGWVDLAEQIVVRSGEAFVAVPDEEK
jgi:hypothetical protein